MHYACDNQNVAEDDLRTFIQDITRRNELVWREVMRQLGELHDQMRENTEQIRENSREIRDMRAESRAHREGLFKLIDRIDRLGEGPGPAAA